MIILKNISKKFKNKLALNNISLEIKNNGIIGLIGPNGAGKTTLLRIITGYYENFSGDIFIFGKNLRDHENKIEIKNNINYLPENNPLYENLTVEEYLKYVSSIYNTNKDSIILEIIKKCNLEYKFKEKIKLLSKGTKQRVGIASCLINDPKILILDEPTNGLDPNEIIEIRKIIKEIGKDKIILISTHIMQEVEALCSRVIIINKGQIIKDENIETLRKEEGYKYNLKFELLKNSNIEEIKQEIQEIKSIKIISLEIEHNKLENIFEELTKK